MEVLKSGTIVFETLVGHNGFHYPSEKYFKVNSTTRVERLSWIPSSGLVAVLAGSRPLWTEEKNIVVER